jgi:hypothetical protein
MVRWLGDCVESSVQSKLGRSSANGSILQDPWTWLLLFLLALGFVSSARLWAVLALSAVGIARLRSSTSSPRKVAPFLCLLVALGSMFFFRPEKNLPSESSPGTDFSRKTVSEPQADPPSSPWPLVKAQPPPQGRSARSPGLVTLPAGATNAERLAVARKFMQGNMPGIAIEHVKDVLATDPRNPEALQMQREIQDTLLDAALNDMQSLPNNGAVFGRLSFYLQQFPGDPRALALQRQAWARYYLLRAQQEELRIGGDQSAIGSALDLVNKALAQDPANSEALHEQSELRQRLSEAINEDTGRMGTFLANGNNSMAKSWAARILHLDPTNAEAIRVFRL